MPVAPVVTSYSHVSLQTNVENIRGKRMRLLKVLVPTVVLLMVSACKTAEQMPVVDAVDLDRFMGDWYVIANIPTFIETDAYNPVETYRLNIDGTVATTFAFNKGKFSGERKEYNPKGFVVEDTGNAVWGMQFIWPFKADYRIVYLDDDYEQTIIGRNARDYVWVMARTPQISDADYSELISVVESLGYELTNLRKSPHEEKK